MSDEYGNTSEQRSEHTSSLGDAVPYAMAGYAAYQSYNRIAPFIKGASDAAWGAQLGTMAARAAGGTTLRAAAGSVGRAVIGAGLRAGVATAATSAAAGAASGAASGAAAGSIVPGVGTLVGAAIGAAAPLIIPHTPLAKPVRAIPIVGGWLSPKQPKKEEIVSEGAPYQTPEGLMPLGGSHTQSGPDYVNTTRAEYNAGRGFGR